MTIAVGVLTPICSIIAADSEETGEFKATVGKVAFYGTLKKEPLGMTFPSIVITGAGDSAYLAAIKQHLFDDFEQATSTDPDEFETSLRTRVKSFYKDHITPFGRTGWNLAVNLIVAVPSHGKLRLWNTSLSAVRRIKVLGTAVVGSGEQWARTAIGIIPTSDIVSSTVAAAYGVFYAKEYAGGCGKQTQLVLLRNGLPPLLARWEALEELDVLFRRYDGYHRSLRNTLLGVPVFDGFTGTEVKLLDFRKQIEEIGKRLYPPNPSTS